jgi:hypothetical protein
LALYAAGITILFAIFADYFGQFYRGGAVMVGVAIALIGGRQSEFGFARLIVIALLIGAAAAGLLTAHRFAGAPPPALLTNNALVYVTLASLSIFAAVRARRLFPWYGKLHK